jgi:ribosomal protein L21
MNEMRIDQNESINLNIGNPIVNNSYISSLNNSQMRSAKTKFIKTKAKVDTNLSLFSGKQSKNQSQATTKRKLGWNDYF